MYIIFMNYVIPITHARRDLLKLVDKVDEEYIRIDLTKQGKIKATLISPDYLDSLEETVYSLENSLEDIRKAEEEITQGNYVSLEKIKKRFKKNAG